MSSCAIVSASHATPFVHRAFARAFLATSSPAAVTAAESANAQRANKAATVATKKVRPTKKSPAPPLMSSSSLPPLALTAPAPSGSTLDNTTSPVQLPPLVAQLIATCQHERAKLRAKSPFLTVKPSEWTESNVAEFQAAGAKIEACTQARAQLVFSDFSGFIARTRTYIVASTRTVVIRC